MGRLWLGALTILAIVARFAYAQNEEDVNSLIDDRNLYGGDIVLTPEQQATLEATSNPTDPFSPQNAVVRSTRSLWPNGQVPYIVDGSLGSNAVDAINQAIAEYRERTCIRFVPRTNEADYVRFYRGSGCFSYIGRIGGPQDISIGRGCEFKGIAMHEMFHALGRWHEQSRPDRDLYVQIREDNIQSGVESNFEAVSSSFVTTQGVSYDLSSIMHYGAYAFSRNGRPTIEPIDSKIPLSSLGQRRELSQQDLQHINSLYCGDDTTATWGSWSSWSRCSRTCNGGTRRRTRACIGGTSCEGSNIDTEQCNTNACPVAATWGPWGAWSTCSATCGGGRQSRSRRCDNGNTCQGQSTQFRDCNTQNCPQPATWGSWGSWSSCSTTCQGGSRTRRRTCQNGNNCPGADFDVEFCNNNIPCTSGPSPNSGEWSEWSECTRSCDGGTRFRVRMCGRTDQCEAEQEECNKQDCNPEPFLRGLQHIGCYYVPRFSSTLGLLEGLTEDISDDPLTRTEPIRKCGQAAREFQYSVFAVSIGYCISGSNSVRDYQYVRAGICNNGIGGYSSGYFVMDVYAIVNVQTFQDSVEEILSPTPTPTPTPSADELDGSSATVVATLTLTVLLLVLATIL